MGMWVTVWHYKMPKETLEIWQNGGYCYFATDDKGNEVQIFEETEENVKKLYERYSKDFGPFETEIDPKTIGDIYEILEDNDCDICDLMESEMLPNTLDLFEEYNFHHYDRYYDSGVACVGGTAIIYFGDFS